MRITEIKNDADYRAAEDRIAGLTADAHADAAMQEREEATQAIVDAVRARGDAAVAEFTERFDKVALRPDEFEVSQDEIDAAMTSVDSGLLDALRRAHANIKAFHEKNLRQSWEERSDDGTVMGQRVSPVASAGVYVPGGTAFYPSSVLMNIAPARVAGVDEIVMVSPPSYNGTILPLVLAAARIAGATRVFRVGGAQAVAALAYGTDTIPAVMKITGPGNMFVMLAKRFVSSFCAIDTEAGPSEVVVMVDDSTDPARAAAELLAQAEHDVDAVAILVSTSRTKVDEVMAAVKAETANLSRADIIRQALADFGEAFVVRDAAEASRLTNTIAPEHLSIQTEDSMATFDTISNAGAVMIGGETPVAVTDYYAGPNHILPTGRRARFSSPLTTEDFRKVTNFVSYSAERLKRDADDIMRLATEEKLTAHARAVEVRL